MQYLDAAREVLRDLERPSAYAVLGVLRETPASELQKACMEAIRERSRMGRSMQELTRARTRLMDTQKRLELDSQTLDRDEWLRELESLRNHYALFDFLAGVRG